MTTIGNASGIAQSKPPSMPVRTDPTLTGDGHLGVRNRRLIPCIEHDAGKREGRWHSEQRQQDGEAEQPSARAKCSGAEPLW